MKKIRSPRRSPRVVVWKNSHVRPARVDRTKRIHQNGVFDSSTPRARRDRGWSTPFWCSPLCHPPRAWRSPPLPKNPAHLDKAAHSGSEAPAPIFLPQGGAYGCVASFTAATRCAAYLQAFPVHSALFGLNPVKSGFVARCVFFSTTRSGPRPPALFPKRGGYACANRSKHPRQWLPVGLPSF